MKVYKKYLMLGLITAVTFYLVWWFLAQYEVAKKYNRNISTLTDVLPLQVTNQMELESYLRENSDAWIYVANTQAGETGRFEAALRNIVAERESASRIVLYNVSDDQLKEDELEKFLNEDVKSFKSAPIIMYFRDEVLTEVYDQTKVSQKGMENFFKRTELIDEIN